MDERHTVARGNLVLFVFLVIASIALLGVGFATTQYLNTTMTVFITNTPPVLVYANVTPNPASPGNTLTFLANITDNNSDTITASIIYYNTTGAAQGGPTNLSLASGTSLTGAIFSNNTYTLPSTAAAGTWTVNITFSDGIATVVNATSFTVSSVLSTALGNAPISFGNQTVGQTAQRAENGTAVAGIYYGTVNGFPLLLNNTGNIPANYSVNGTSLVGQTTPAQAIGPGNVTFNITDTGVGSAGGKIALPSAAPATIANGVTGGSVQKVYFYISTPNGISQQNYTGNMTFNIQG